MVRVKVFAYDGGGRLDTNMRDGFVKFGFYSFLGFWFFFAAQFSVFVQQVKADPPYNIVFIMADDLGWTEMNCHKKNCPGTGNACTCRDISSKYDSLFYETPNLSTLRSCGIRFTSAYAPGNWCAPSRASILTGKYVHNLDFYQKGPGGIGPMRVVSPAEVTIAEALDAGGTDYFSGIIGKSYVSTVSIDHPLDYYLFREGFDVQIGAGRVMPYRSIDGSTWLWEQGMGWKGQGGYAIPAADYMLSGWQAIKGGPYLPGLGDPNPGNPNDFLTDSITERAVEFIRQAHASGRPFFLYLPYHAPHAFMDGDPSDIHYFMDKTGLAANWKFNVLHKRVIENRERYICYDSAGRSHSAVLMNISTKSNPLVTDDFIKNRSTKGRNQAIALNRNNEQYVEIPDYKGVTGTSDRTVCAWIQAKEDGGVVSYGTQGSETGGKWVMTINPTLFVSVWGGSVSGSTRISDGKWHHVTAVLRSGGSPAVSDITLYVDGSVEKMHYTNESLKINTLEQEPVHIGAYDAIGVNGITGYFEGKIDDVRIYSRSLTANEIRELYNQTLHENAYRAAYIRKLDNGVGTVLKELDRLDLKDKTYVIFFSDNGAPTPCKLYDDKTYEGNSLEDMAAYDYWTSNTPLRGQKAEMYEGGSRVPLIIAGPGIRGPSEDDDAVCQLPVSGTDFLPTFVDLAYGVREGHAAFRKSKYPGLDGTSFAPVLFTDRQHWPSKLTNRTIYLAISPVSASMLWVGNEFDGHKLIGVRDKYELYDLEKDLSETNNLYDPQKIEHQNAAALFKSGLNERKPYLMRHQQRIAFRRNVSSVQEAIDDPETKDGDTIILPPATVHENNITITKSLTLKSEYDLAAQYPETDPWDIVKATILDGYGHGRVITINAGAAGTVILEGLTITNGCAEKGGGVYISSAANVKLENCIIAENNADTGGGLYGNPGSSGTISHCRFTNNKALGSGGGAIAEFAGTVENCVVSCNLSKGSGGGLYCCEGKIINCTISDNIAEEGGGLYGYKGMITNSILWNNPPNQFDTSVTEPNFCCIKGWKTGETKNTGADPKFVHAPVFVDAVTGTGIGHGRVHGAVWQEQSPIGGSLSFNGIGDSIRVADDDSLNPTADFTISMWIKNKYPVYEKIYGKKTGAVFPLITKKSAFTLQIRVFSTEDNVYESLQFYSGSGRRAEGILPDIKTDQPGVVMDGRWHHVVGTIDWDDLHNGVWSVYIDGEMAEQAYVEKPRKADGNSDVLIGTDGDSNFFAGLMDDIRIYRCALSSADIQVLTAMDERGYPAAENLEAHWKLDGNAFDLQGKHDGQVTGGIWNKAGPMLVRGSLLFGGGDFVDIPGWKGISGNRARTVTAWIRTDRADPQAAVVQWGRAAAGQLWMLYLKEGKAACTVMGAGIEGTTQLADDKWHHLAAVLPETGSDSTLIKLYVDGQPEGKITGACRVNTSYHTDVHIGARKNDQSGYADYFRGLIDEIRIYDRALNRTEIAALAGLKEFRPSSDTMHVQKNLIVHFPFDNGGVDRIAWNHALSTFAVKKAERYKIGDLIDYDYSSVNREVIGIDTAANLITFFPPMPVPPQEGKLLCIWKNHGSSTLITDYHLQDHSPCINAGDSRQACGETDIDQESRIQGKAVDIGADESQIKTER